MTWRTWGVARKGGKRAVSRQYTEVRRGAVRAGSCRERRQAVDDAGLRPAGVTADQERQA